MYLSEQGIKVHSCKKSKDVIVVLSSGEERYYSTGQMLLEILSDEALYVLKIKVLNMIKLIPSNDEEISEEGIIRGVDWLYGAIDEDDIAVAMELFRSSFYEALSLTIDRIMAGSSCGSIGELFINAYEEYLEQLESIVVIALSVGATNSGLSDEYQSRIAETFNCDTEELNMEYFKTCSVRYRNGNTYKDTYHITNFTQMFLFEYCRMKKNKVVLKQCENCGRLFIPQKRSDSIYCINASPQKPEKTCGEIGYLIKRQEKRKNDPNEKAYHNKMCKMYNNLRRVKGYGFAEDSIKKLEEEIRKEKKKR